MIAESSVAKGEGRTLTGVTPQEPESNRRLAIAAKDGERRGLARQEGALSGTRVVDSGGPRQNIQEVGS